MSNIQVRPGTNRLSWNVQTAHCYPETTHPLPRSLHSVCKVLQLAASGCVPHTTLRWWHWHSAKISPWCQNSSSPPADTFLHGRKSSGRPRHTFHSARYNRSTHAYNNWEWSTGYDCELPSPLSICINWLMVSWMVWFPITLCESNIRSYNKSLSAPCLSDRPLQHHFNAI